MELLTRTGADTPMGQMHGRLYPTDRYATKRKQQNNYFQAIEGGIDSSHISYLHRGGGGQGFIGLPQYRDSAIPGYLAKDTAPKYEVEKTDTGLLMGARRNAEEGYFYWRIPPFLMPWYTMIPPFEDVPRGAHAWVPIDDENVWTWSFNWNPERPLSTQELAILKEGRGTHVDPKQTKENEYLINRDLQASGKSFTGIKGVGAQDMAVQETQGRIVDRSSEMLGTSDTAIIAARRCMLNAVRQFQKGINPPALSKDEQRLRSVSVVLEEGVPFQVGAEKLLQLQPEDYIDAKQETQSVKSSKS